MAIRLHKGDLPASATFGDSVAIDTETLGLQPHRDRLCVVQLSAGDGSADVVQIARGQTSAPNLQKLLADRAVTKIFHFGRFDIAVLHKAFGVEIEYMIVDARTPALAVDPDRLLHNFRAGAGLEPKAPGYGGGDGRRRFA